MLWIGVDPGKKGAIAVIGEGILHGGAVVPMPVISGDRDEYDIVTIVGELARVSRPCTVTLEKGQPLPPKMGGSSANFWRGYSRGLFEGIIATIGLPLRVVSPREWQKVMHQGTSGEDLKQRSIQAAQRYYPGVSLRRTDRCRTLDHNMAEALLLADYGRRFA